MYLQNFEQKIRELMKILLKVNLPKVQAIYVMFETIVLLVL